MYKKFVIKILINFYIFEGIIHLLTIILIINNFSLKLFAINLLDDRKKYGSIRTANK